MADRDPRLDDYSLMLYTAATQGAAPVGDITRIADVWRRSTRYQGGYWRGSFRVNSEDQSLSKWFSQYKGYKLREYVGPTIAWEGLIYAMKTGGGGSYLTVDVAGYVYTANWRYVTASDENVGNADAWIRDIVDTDCEFLAPGKFEENTAQVFRGGDPIGRAWEEILKIAELGDASANLWRFWVGPDQLAHYRKQNMTPLYNVYAGLEREWTYEEMRNYVSLTYTNEDDEERDIPATSTGQQAQSIARHGRFEENLTKDKVAENGAQAYQKSFLAEHAWPWARPTGARAGLVVYDRNLSPVHPRLVQPVIARDLGYALSGKEPGSVFEDARDFILDEVEVNQKSGLTVRTAWADEAELLAAQEEYDNWMDALLERSGKTHAHEKSES